MHHTGRIGTGSAPPSRKDTKTTGCGDGETRDSRGGEGARARVRSGLGRAIAHQSSTLADSEWEATRLRKASPGRDALVACRSPAADPQISCNLSRPRSVDLFSWH